MKMTKKQAARLDTKNGYLQKIARAATNAELLSIHPEIRVFATWNPDFRSELATAYYDRKAVLKILEKWEKENAKSST